MMKDLDKTAELVKAIPTITELLIRFPTIGSNPHKKVRPITSGKYFRPIVATKIAVNTVLILDITSCAPITLSKLP